ncbi:MAG: hypothetical protein HYS13_07885 [Planctomycetia bacterium]|nr:hypothetical protein [Planctomycetia bacterium]
MSEEITEKDIWMQLFALADRCQPIVTKYTVCIYAHQQNRLQVVGTGLVLRIADKHFLMSAAHVLDFTFYHGLPFFAAAVSETPAPPVPLLFVRRHSSARRKDLSEKDPNLRDYDPVDVSVAELQDETSASASAPPARCWDGSVWKPAPSTSAGARSSADTNSRGSVGD